MVRTGTVRNRYNVGMRWRILLSTILAASVLAGCNSSSPATEAGSGESGKSGNTKPIKITMIAKSSTNPFFLSTKTGADAAAADLSKKLGRPVEVDWRTPPQEDGQVQAERLAQAVNEGTDAVLLACSDAGKLKGAIDDAAAKGVPVITFDSDVPESKRLGFLGSDNYEMGYKIGEELVKLTEGKGNVALLCGNQNAPNLAIRRKGTEDALKKAPGIKIVGTYYNPEVPQDAAAEVLRAMKSNPEIDAWAFIGGWPLFTTTLLTDLDPKRVRVVSADALPQELLYVDAGVVPVLVAQRSYDFGYKGIELLVDHVVNGTKIEATNKTDLTIVNKDNLKEWAKQLKDWGFTDVDPKFLE